MKKNVKQLEEIMVKYSDLVKVPVMENCERLVALPSSFFGMYISPFNDMAGILNNKMLVRKSVLEKLISAQRDLEKRDKDIALCLTYGYRSLEIQTKRFKTILKKVDTFFPNPLDLYEEAHRFVAVPIVAGHPTGGAIDITLMDRKTKEFLDFGSKQYDYSSKECYVFWSSLSESAKKNRALLREVLMNEGFAPFDGEWWHFSYGDREWAYYYQRKEAIYSQILFKDLDKFMI